MFTFMWRVKRANYMVLKMWRGLKLLHKEVNKLIPGVYELLYGYEHSRIGTGNGKCCYRRFVLTKLDANSLNDV